MTKPIHVITLILIFLSSTAFSDRSDAGVLFLLIDSDIRAAGMGGTGCALSNEAYAAYYNPGLLGISENSASIGGNTCKWLPVLTDDDRLFNFFANFGFGDPSMGKAGLGYTHLSFGQSSWTGEGGELLGTINSNEWALMLSYGLPMLEKEKDKLGLGMNAKLIKSKGLEEFNAFAFDVGMAYERSEDIFPFTIQLRAGLSASNLGPDISYSDLSDTKPLPRTLRAGGAVSAIYYGYGKNTFRTTLQYDINKDLILWGNDPAKKEWHEAIKSIGLEMSLFETVTGRIGWMIDYDYVPKSGYDANNEEFNAEHWRSINYFTCGGSLSLSPYLLGDNFPFTWNLLDIAWIPEQFDGDEGKQVLSNTWRFGSSLEIHPF